MSIIGEEGVEKYETFTYEDEQDKEDILKVIEKFDEECQYLTNELNERYIFLKRRQGSDETIDEYVTKLKVLVSTCGYINPNE